MERLPEANIAPHRDEPSIVDFADVCFEVVAGYSRALAVVTDVRARRQFIWDGISLPHKPAAASG
jgi:hypothetical protein